MLVAGKERCIRCMHLLDEEGHCAKCEFDASSYKQPNMALPLGTCLNERYFLGKVLGEGGFGITYVAWDIVLMVPVAVKEYFPSGIATREKEGPQTGTLQIYEGKSELEFEKGKEDFLKEARSLSRFMKLPSIVSVRDFFQENRTAYIVMEYVEGTRVRNYIRKNGKMSGEQVLALMEPVIHSLCDIHKTGLIHRDISIDNLMFDENGQLKLIDFGAARNVELPENTITVSIKRGFSPEEQYRAKGEQGPWTDLYSLCGTMYFMLTGKIPDESVERVYADHLVPLRQWEDVKLPMQAKCAIDKGMAVLAKDRWQDMLGDSLMVAPVFTKEGDVTYYLPEGKWTHLLSNEKREGGHWLRENYDFFSLPLFARENSIVAIGANNQQPDYDYGKDLTLHVFELSDKASAKVCDSKGNDMLSVSAVNENGVITFKFDGKAENLSVLLRNVENVKNVSGAEVEQNELGTVLKVNADLSDVVVTL